MNVLAIDPGEIHCGVAYFDKRGNCSWTVEMTPMELFQFIGQTMQNEVIIVESFRLYPDKAMAQQWSQLKTVETIGVIRYLCLTKHLDMVEQAASIKNVAKRQMKARDVENKAVVERKGGHAADAFMHGWYYCHKPIS